jgi:hypothetical protein
MEMEFLEANAERRSAERVNRTAHHFEEPESRTGTRRKGRQKAAFSFLKLIDLLLAKSYRT